MTVKELMADITPNPLLEGIATSDDMVFAINFTDSSYDDLTKFIVAQAGITELSGELSAVESTSTYLRSGSSTVKTGNSKSFTMTGDRYRQDPFQDEVFSHKIKYGTGIAVIKPYVYYDMLTGKGESGMVSINVTGDLSNGAGSNAGVGATFNVQNTPAEFTYTGTTRKG